MFVLQQKASGDEAVINNSEYYSAKKLVVPIFRDVWTLFTQISFFELQKFLKYCTAMIKIVPLKFLFNRSRIFGPNH